MSEEGKYDVEGNWLKDPQGAAEVIAEAKIDAFALAHVVRLLRITGPLPSSADLLGAWMVYRVEELLSSKPEVA